MKRKKKVGRPRTQRPDMQVFNAQMTPEGKARLMALAQIEGKHAYALLEAAFWDRWKSLPAAKRKKAETIASILEETTKTK